MVTKESLGSQPEDYSGLCETPQSIDQLFKDIVDCAKRGEKRDLKQDMRDYLGLLGVDVKVEHQQFPDTNKLLVFAPNHHSRRSIFSTMESFNAVAVTAVGAFNVGLTEKHTAWVIKDLHLPKIGFGKLAREVQNASHVTYGSIPIKVEKKVETNGRLLPNIKERFANLPQFQKLLFENIISGNNIGYFPEQKPSGVLKQFHPNYPRFIRGIQAGVDEFQVMPVAIFYERNCANVNFGSVIKVNQGSDPFEVSQTTMLAISANMPRSLRGAYGS